LTYKQLFAHNAIVKKLATIQLVAYFGAWFSNVAIYTLLVQLNASPLVISFVVAMHFIPGILLAPFSGFIVDKIEAKRLMLILMSIEFSMTLCFLFINSLEEIWLLFIFIFIRMSAASMFFTTEMTLMPKILSGEILAKVNEIHSIIWSFTFTAGMAIGGIVVNLFGIKTAFLVDGLFFVCAIVLVLSTNFNYEHEVVKEKVFQSIKEGIVYLKENKFLFHYILLHASVGFTAFDSLVTLLADFHYKYVIAVPLAIGLTNAIRSVGLMIGPFLITNWVNKERIFYVFLFQGIAIMIWGLVQQNFYLGLLGSFITGLVSTTLWSHTYAMLQEKVNPKYLGRVLAYNEMFFMLTMALTTLFIGIMANYVTLDIITISLGIAFIIVAIYYKKVLKMGI
jgi:MFS family permease